MRVKGIRGELYFHVLDGNRKLRFGDDRIVEPGSEMKAKTQLTAKGTPRILPRECQFGMHGCKDVGSSALSNFELHKWVCVVRLWGNVRTFYNKSAGLRRKVVAMRQIESYIDFPQRWGSNQDVYDWVMAEPWSPE